MVFSLDPAFRTGKWGCPGRRFNDGVEPKIKRGQGVIFLLFLLSLLLTSLVRPRSETPPAVRHPRPPVTAIGRVPFTLSLSFSPPTSPNEQIGATRYLRRRPPASSPTTSEQIRATWTVGAATVPDPCFSDQIWSDADLRSSPTTPHARPRRPAALARPRAPAAGRPAALARPCPHVAGRTHTVPPATGRPAALAQPYPHAAAGPAALARPYPHAAGGPAALARPRPPPATLPRSHDPARTPPAALSHSHDPTARRRPTCRTRTTPV